MKVSETTKLLRKKIFKVLGLLFLVRLCLYIPVPNIDLDIFLKGQELNPIFGFTKALTGSSFLGIGSLGILPYINSSIIIQLLIPVFPNLERLQKEDGEIGKQKINQYTRYLTFGWSIVLSTATAFFLIKPIVFSWNLFLAFKIILSLTTGSILSMWFAELITEEDLGNGSSMIIFINIVGNIPNSFNELSKKFSTSSYGETLSFIVQGLSIYLFIVMVVILFQDAYKKITIVSARQLDFSSSNATSQSPELKNSYIPIKLNQGGIMPLVFSSTIATFLYYPLQLAILSLTAGTFIASTEKFFVVLSVGINIVLVLFFSVFYALLVLKPNDIAQNLAKMTYTIPGIRQGNQTTQYLKETISRLAYMGGMFLALLSLGPILLGNIFQITVFKNVTSLLILVGVITDITAQIRGYLISRNYESFKKT